MSMNSKIRLGNFTLKRMGCLCVMLIILANIGCDRGPSFVNEVSGTVKIDGKPFSKVKVTFVPQINVDGSFMPTGVTDEDGSFTLSMLGNDAGCPAAKCKVTITESSPPDEIQENLMSENPDDRMLSRYLKSLKLRPIPKTYTRLKLTPLVVDVSDDNHVFDFELER